MNVVFEDNTNAMAWTSIPEFAPNPIVYGLFMNITVILTIAFTSSSSLFRPAFLPILVIGAYSAVFSCSNFIQPYLWAGFVSGDIVIGLLHYVEVALVSKWSFDAQGPTSNASSGVKLRKTSRERQTGGVQTRLRKSLWSEIEERLKFGYLVKTSSRNEGTPWIVKNTPPFSSKDAKFVPSRKAFCFQRLAMIVVTFLFFDLLSQQKNPLEDNAQLYSSGRVRIFTGDNQNLTTERILTRLISVVMCWICAALFISSEYSIYAVLSVALHIKDVRQYPPSFGPVSEAYTIRQFWG